MTAVESAALARRDVPLHAATAEWFSREFDRPTPAQLQAWPEIAAGRSTLLLAPTGSGKTLAAFLIAIDRIMFHPRSDDRPQQHGSSRATSRSAQRSDARAIRPDKSLGRDDSTRGVRVVYVSPLKALGVDVERNLKSPLAGIHGVAQRRGDGFHLPRVGVRSGDTPARDRVQLNRNPPDILITTPESLYLLLTSRAREILVDVETVIVDEIHSLVGNKRGAHLFVSLERLERLRRAQDRQRQPTQRIGLSATQRPLDEIARLLGGAEATADPDQPARPRPVTIVEAGRRKPLELTVEVPVEDMTRLGEQTFPSKPAAAGPSHPPSPPSIWPSIHPRLVELIRGHRSTMIFVNSRRLAERLAAAINETAEAEIAMAHHGSIAKESRVQIEDRLKRGELPAIVATSSLELGIDMGAVDLVIQIEAPPSIASGLQRIGRAGHQVDARSKGVIFPKYRGDLLACSAAVGRMMRGEVEETFFPRNPLDVLAQQLVAMTAEGPQQVDELYATIRGSAPFADLPRSAFDSVLDLLAGRYPSDEFAELRPRLNWDRIAGVVEPRKGTQRLAILNAGTIPDRGLYGVFLADGSEAVADSASVGPNRRGSSAVSADAVSADAVSADAVSAETGGASSATNAGRGRRVGELDEEMVFETRPGDVFLLGASSWRVLEITNDRVLVAPAPGEPGRMPFWRGDGPGRPLEFGRAIGLLARQLLELPREQAESQLTADHALDQRAARNLVAYLHDQVAACGAAPTDKTIVVECFLDEVGDWRVAILSPFGARVHAPWATAVRSRLASEATGEVDMMWTDDGIIFRLPEADSPPPLEPFFPRADEVENLVVDQLGSTALFAARFRENAARALLLPRNQPGKRTPLWLQRRRAADLLSVATRYPSFPILLETYRECLRDVFDVGGLKSLLRDIEQRAVRVRQVETRTASLFASSLMFNYVGNFIYDGDAPLAERRAATLALDHAQLRELLGDAELRELLDADAVEELALELQRLDGTYPVRDADGLHDLLQFLGDLTADEIALRCELAGSDALASGEPASDEPANCNLGAVAARQQRVGDWLNELLAARRVISLKIAGEVRYAAAEDTARFRDALDIVAPLGLPEAFLESVDEPLIDLVSRYARTHVPFKPEDVASRLGLSLPTVVDALRQLMQRDRLLEGEFLPGGRGREWCDVEVLKKLKRRSLARLRKQVEPVEPAALARFLPLWHGLDRPRRGLDGLFDAVEQLQGMPLPASDLERLILPARVAGYEPSDLDALCASGEVVWRGVESLGDSDGRVALYLADHALSLAPPAMPLDGPQAAEIRRLLAERGALFFDDLAKATGRFRNELLASLWELVWNGEVTNDTLTPLRSLRRQPSSRRAGGRRRERSFRSRHSALAPGSEGRWTLLVRPGQELPSATQRQAALANQLLERYGVVTRELAASENPVGGFAGLYPVFKAMEESGRIRRGYFVAGQGAAQFAVPGAEDRLRRGRTSGVFSDDKDSNVLILAATDPANAYGAALPWPDRAEEDGARPARAAGASVVLIDGRPAGYLSATGRRLLTFPLEAEPDRTLQLRRLAAALASLANESTAVLLTQIDADPASASPLAPLLEEQAFVRTSRGMLHRRTEP